MPSEKTFKRVERIVRTMAVSIGLIAGLVVPGVVIHKSYNDHVAIVKFHTQMTANIMAEHAYVRGRLWRFTENQIRRQIQATIQPDTQITLTVFDPDDKPVVKIGAAETFQFADTLRVPIIVQGEQQGFVEAEFELSPILVTSAKLMLLGMMLGIGSYLCVYYLPLRELRAALTELDESYNQVRRESEKAVLANRTKSEFLANINHELRTPLNAIIGFSEIMQSALFGPLDERYRIYSSDINKSGRHLLRIIREVLDISEIESGKLTVNTEIIDLAEVLTSCDRLIRPRAQKAGVTLTMSPLPGGQITLQADPLRLKQVVLNLLSNAVKFTPSGGTVRVDQHADHDSMVTIEVADTGCGMTEEQIESSFQPFRQIDNKHTRKHQGLGLGLPLAKQLTELQGGSLTMVSEPGKGTTVTLRLPLDVTTKKLSA